MDGTAAILAKLTLLSAGICASAAPGVTGLSLTEIQARLAGQETSKREQLESFSVVRHYKLDNTRMSEPAEMTVRLTYRQGAGKSFQVIEYRHAQGLSRRVLDRLLEAEVEGSRPNATENGSLTPEHYEFALEGMDTVAGRECYVLTLRPLKKSKYLVQGKAWIDAQDFAAVKVEGRLAASVSTWTGRPYVVQEYQKHGDFWMASMNRSVAESHLCGRSELTVAASDYEIQPTRTPESIALNLVGR